VGHYIGHLSSADGKSLDAAQLEGCLLLGDPVEHEAALGVVEKAEVLASLLDRDHVLETAGIGDVGADPVINLDRTAVHDHLGLSIGERVLQPVADQDDHGDALTQLVRTSGRTGSKHARQLVKHPVLGATDALHVLPRTTRHLELHKKH